MHPLNETLMARIAAAHSIYGIRRIQITSSCGSLMVEYDASRLTANEVEAGLASLGIPIACRS
jgi:allophanate hydrolase subunit 1